MSYPLEAYRIINFGWVAAAPYAASMLGDMGAEVIKVESMSRIDSLRLSPDNIHRDPDKDPWFHSGVRSQLSITVDLRHPEAVPLLKRLVKIGDVVIENFSPRVMKEIGLDYASLKRVNPAIVMISLSAAGQYGPLADAQAYGPSLNGIAGLDSIVGYPGERVLGMQQAYADFNAAVHTAFAILAALYYRKRTGKGQYVDMAQLETLISTMGEGIMEYTMNGEVLGTQGNQHPTMAPHGNYPCQGEDKWVSIAVNTEEEWKGLCEAMGNPPWTLQGKFADKYLRLQNRSELDSLISQWTVNHTHYQVTDLLQRAGAAAAPLLDTEERFFDPHFQKRKAYLEVEHPATGRDWVAGIPWKLSETPGEIRCPSPLLGQHNRYVFGELLGMSEEEISRIR